MLDLYLELQFDILEVGQELMNLSRDFEDLR